METSSLLQKGAAKGTPQASTAAKFHHAYIYDLKVKNKKITQLLQQ